MKIGEALTLRSQLQIRFQQLRERLKASVLVQEGEKPPEDPEELLKELESVADHSVDRGYDIDLRTDGWPWIIETAPIIRREELDGLIDLGSFRCDLKRKLFVYSAGGYFGPGYAGSI